MHTTHDIGARFWHTIKLRKGTPLTHRAVTNEAEPPYRTSNSLVVRLWPLRFGLVFGKWLGTNRTEDEAMLHLLRTDLGVFDSDKVHEVEEMRDWQRPAKEKREEDWLDAYL